MVSGESKAELDAAMVEVFSSKKLLQTASKIVIDAFGKKVASVASWERIRDNLAECCQQVAGRGCRRSRL